MVKEKNLDKRTLIIAVIAELILLSLVLINKALVFIPIIIGIFFLYLFFMIGDED